MSGRLLPLSQGYSKHPHLPGAVYLRVYQSASGLSHPKISRQVSFGPDNWKHGALLRPLRHLDYPASVPSVRLIKPGDRTTQIVTIRFWAEHVVKLHKLEGLSTS